MPPCSHPQCVSSSANQRQATRRVLAWLGLSPFLSHLAERQTTTKPTTTKRNCAQLCAPTPTPPPGALAQDPCKPVAASGPSSLLHALHAPPRNIDLGLPSELAANLRPSSESPFRTRARARWAKGGQKVGKRWKGTDSFSGHLSPWPTRSLRHHQLRAISGALCRCRIELALALGPWTLDLGSHVMLANSGQRGRIRKVATALCLPCRGAEEEKERKKEACVMCVMCVCACVRVVCAHAVLTAHVAATSSLSPAVSWVNVWWAGGWRGPFAGIDQGSPGQGARLSGFLIWELAELRGSFAIGQLDWVGSLSPYRGNEE